MITLSPEVKVYPSTHVTTSSDPFLTGNSVSVFKLELCGSSEQVPECVVCNANLNRNTELLSCLQQATCQCPDLNASADSNKQVD